MLDQTAEGLNGRSLVSKDLLQKIVEVMSVATTSTIDHGKQVVSALSDKSNELESVKSKLEEYKRLANTDPLTQIWNRRAFDREIAGIYNSNRGILFKALILSTSTGSRTSTTASDIRSATRCCKVSPTYSVPPSARICSSPAPAARNSH